MSKTETIFKMTEAANELFSYGEDTEAMVILLSIDRLCEGGKMEDMPEEAISLNIAIDNKYGIDIFATDNSTPLEIQQLMENS